MSIGLDSVRLDADGWRLRERNERDVIWNDLECDIVRLTFFDNPTILPAESLTALRDYFRGVAQNGKGAMVSVDVITAGGLPAIRNVFKYMQEPHGITALGSLLIPRRDLSWVVRVQCPEHPPTGGSEVVVLLALESKESGVWDRWMRDPYDPSRRDPYMKIIADDEEYDGVLPTHPLTRVRRKLAAIATTARIDPAVAASPAFPLPKG